MGFFKPNVEKMKAKEDVKGLIKALTDKSEDVRDAAAKALGEIGEPALSPLIEALKDENRDVREAVAKALVKVGEPAVKLLIQARQVSREYVRRQERVLGMAGNLREVEPVIQALKDSDRRVREAVKRALGEVREPQRLSSKKVTAKATSKKTKKQPPADLEGRAIKFESLDSFRELIRSKYNLSTHEFQGTIEPETLIGILEQVEESISIYWSIEKETVKEVGRGSVFSSHARLIVFPKGSPRDEPCDNMLFPGLAKFHDKRHLDYFLESTRHDKADIGIGDDLVVSRFIFNLKWDNYENQPHSREHVTVNDLKKLVADRKAALGLR